MDRLEHENQILREKVTTLQGRVERQAAVITALLAAHNQSSVLMPTRASPVQPSISDMPVATVFAGAPQHVMLEGYLWSTFSDEVLRPGVSEVRTPFVQRTMLIPQSGPASPQATMTYPTPLVRATQRYPKMDDLRKQLDEMNHEIKAHRGKGQFGKTARELCLVPNVVIPPKFKVPDFENYEGKTCPEEHLRMYARKMSAQIDNDKLLVHYFQNSLCGASLKWYGDLNQADIRTFKDLGEAFIRQYQHNMDLAPDRSELRSMAQREGETFKQYAQRWRELAAQVRPPLKENELVKIFLNTLDQFYYKKMVASAPRDFAGMMAMGMRLEEGVREGRLVKGNTSSNSCENDFLNEKDQEVGMLKSWPQQQNPRYQLQLPPHQQQPRQRAPRTQIDLIPMTYAELLPILLEMNLVHTKAPLPAPTNLPAGYRDDLFCAFHQGAPGHDIEDCFPLKKIVQKLIKKNLLPFLG